MGKLTRNAWILVLLLPLIPVVILYSVFAGQNYFELRDAARGIVAFGPIAAYIAMLFIGYKLMIGIEKEARQVNPLVEELKGEWALQSVSIHNTAGSGDCFIENNHGQIVCSGTLRENGRNLGTWQSEMTLLKDHNLYIFYTMSQVKDTGTEKFDGICTLTFGGSPVTKLTGTWIIVGLSGMAGEMTLTRGGS